MAPSTATASPAQCTHLAATRWPVPVALCTQLFASYKCAAGVRHTFGLPLNVLLDTLNLFASAPTAEGLTLRYPGPNNELECG